MYKQLNCHAAIACSATKRIFLKTAALTVIAFHTDYDEIPFSFVCVRLVLPVLVCYCVVYQFSGEMR